MAFKRILVLFLFWASSILPLRAEIDPYDYFMVKALATNLFKPGAAFSAKMQGQGKGAQANRHFTLDIYMDGPSFRSDLNLTNIVGQDIRNVANMLAAEMGLGRVITLAQTDTKQKMMLYPDKKAYHVVPIAQLEGVVIRKIADGTETIDGHVCRRVKINVGEEDPVTIWFATNLQDLPIQMLFGTGLQINLSNLKFGKQDPELFKLPTGYTQYKDRKEIIDLAFERGKYSPTNRPFSERIDPKFRSRPITKADLQGMKRYQADQKALEFQKKRAAEGNATAQYDLGLRYWKGDGVDKDENLAMDLMQKAAAGGNSQAKKFLETTVKQSF